MDRIGVDLLVRSRVQWQGVCEQESGCAGSNTGREFS